MLLKLNEPYNTWLKDFLRESKSRVREQIDIVFIEEILKLIENEEKITTILHTKPAEQYFKSLEELMRKTKPEMNVATITWAALTRIYLSLEDTSEDMIADIAICFIKLLDSLQMQLLDAESKRVTAKDMRDSIVCEWETMVQK